MNKTHLSLLFCLLLGGCGTVTRGFRQTIEVNSNVTGADVLVDGEKMCQTPCSFPLTRSRSSHRLTVVKEGYDTESVFIESSFNIWVIGNITSAAGSLFGSTTDQITGGMWEYNLDTYYANMMPNKELSQEKREKEKSKKAIRRFILKNYDELRKEAASSQSEYTSSLSVMTGVGGTELKEMCKSMPSEVSFTEQVVKRYEEEKD